MTTTTQTEGCYIIKRIGKQGGGQYVANPGSKIDLHLANADDGKPLHAKENGWYYDMRKAKAAIQSCDVETEAK